MDLVPMVFEQGLFRNKESVMMIMTMKRIWRQVGVCNGRPILFSFVTFPGAASVAAALDVAFPWDETPEVAPTPVVDPAVSPALVATV